MEPELSHLVQLPVASNRDGAKSFGILEVPATFVRAVSTEKSIGAQRCIIELSDGSCLIVNRPFRRVLVDLAEALEEL